MSNTQIDLEVVDAVVVGGGGAGLAAAVSAGTRGMQIVLLEKQAELGGTTRISVGSWIAACTRLQRRANIADSADDFRADMEAFCGDMITLDDPKLRCLLAVESGVTVDWLEDLGVVFAGPFPDPVHRVNRMHNVMPGSRMYIAKLAKAAKRAGVTIRTRASARDLVTDKRGNVVGLDYSDAKGQRRILARRGIVLASGDFSGNREMRAAYLAPAAVAALPLNPDSMGDGHHIAQRAGAALRNMDMVFGPLLRFSRLPKAGLTDRLPEWSWLARLLAQCLTRAPSWMLKPVINSLLITHMSPSDRLFKEGALLVDLDGKRLNTAAAAASLANARDVTGYILLDQRIAELFTRYPYFLSTAPGIAYAYFHDYARARPDIVHRGRTVQELAGKIGIPIESLRVATEGLQHGALFALGPVRAMLTTTEGSLAIDESCRVLKEDGTPLEGLYAAGGAGQSGMPLRGHGLHIAWAMTTGRIAGEMIARRVPVDLEEYSPAGQAKS